MSIDDDPFSDQIFELFEDPNFSYDPSSLIFDDPYINDNPNNNNDDFFGADDSWWIQSQCLSQTPQHQQQQQQQQLTLHELPLDLDTSKKRKAIDGSSQVKEGDVGEVEQGKQPVRKPVGNRKATASKLTSNSNSSNREGRWAEQLLNPCAAAITAGNPSRVQHFLYVLDELASFTGDPNHRLAAHGLRALMHHLGSPLSFSGVASFASSSTKFFRESLMIFNDINPWFRIPNSFANSSIMKIVAEQKDQRRSSTLHILDIGVSHGIQWPTLLEELTHAAGGPPPLVRLTVVVPAIDNHQARSDTPFLNPPFGYDFSPNLLGFAKAININLQINIVDESSLRSFGESSREEILIACVQFRMHNLNHHAPDERTEFLRVLRSLNPTRVVLSENDAECSCSNCEAFTIGFPRRVDYMWKFLDSTSAAFKGRWNEERKMMEGEAAKVLISAGEMNETKEKWCERMRGVGFIGDEFGEEAIDGARMLLRKYDNNWEMKVDERDRSIDLSWKGHPISFTSLWKIDPNASDCFE